MRLFLSGLMLAASLPLPAAAQDMPEAARTLAPDTTRTLRFKQAIARVDVDREGIISVRAPSAHTLVVTGLAQGHARLTVHTASGALVADETITVAPSGLATDAALADDSRLRQMHASRAGGPNGGVVLTGAAGSLAARADAQRLASASGEGPVINAASVSGEQVVAVDVQFAAVDSSTLHQLGFNFSRLSGDIQGAVVAPNALSSYAMSSSGLNVTASAPIQSAFNLFLSSSSLGVSGVLSAMSSVGLSRLLAQPTLLVRSGDQATFLAGGEVPVPVPQNSSSGTSTIAIQYKEYGVRLTVAPVVLDHNRIVLKVAPEVSQLDYANGVQLQGYTVPGLQRRSAETTVELGSGESFVIAGLSYTNSTSTKQKVPVLGSLPVLGNFFRENSNQGDHQELIIVATPRLVGPVRAGSLPPLPGTMPASATPAPGLADQPADTFGVVRR